MKNAEWDLLVTAWQKVEEARAILEHLITFRSECGELQAVVQALEESSKQIIKRFRILIEFEGNARSNEDAFE